jgi:hypothetical protein
MSKIFELFGYKLKNWDAAAKANCAKAWCPFMNAECDGGGNRSLSTIDLRKSQPELMELAKLFPGREQLQCGVCSLEIKEGEQPWIVCPRRLLSIRNTNQQVKDYQQKVKDEIFKYWNPSACNLRVWSEVKMKMATETSSQKTKQFDYTFDYVIAGEKPVTLSEAARILNKTESATRSHVENFQYTLAKRGDIFWVDDFPSDPILILEIMTSSTSGGDKNSRTQISQACVDAILHPLDHNGPGINYRQVWARMVSQLFVKSQVGKSWGGSTFWLIQDVLANYISNTTALDLSTFLADIPNEVNILSFGYGEKTHQTSGVIELEEAKFYAGPIDATNNSTKGSFVDIIKINALPEKVALWHSLFSKKPCATFISK